jgi:hypothetical protein
MAKVRIRKAGPGEKAGYYNSTAMFLKKAQDGTEVQSQPAEEGAQDNSKGMLNAYYEYAYDQLMNDVPIPDVYGTMVNKGLPQELASQLINSLVDELVNRGLMNPEYKRKKEEAEKAEQPEQEEQPVEEEEESEVAMPQNQDMRDMEEEDMTDDSFEMARGGFYQEGGENFMDQYDEMKDNTPVGFDMQSMIEQTPGVQEGVNLPSLSDYIPDYTGATWENMNALQSQQEEPMQKMGGFAKKKDFVKNVMSLLKKQEGGEGENQEEPDQTLGKGNPMDTMTEDVQKHKNNFLRAVKEKATTVKTEEMYDKLMKSNDPDMQQLAMQRPQQQQNAFQTGGFTGGDNPLYRFTGGGQEMQEDPDYYEADFLPEARYGYSTGNLIRTAQQDGAEAVNELFVKNPPKVGETNSAYLLRVTGNPGFYNNRSVWDGQKFTGDSGINTGKSGMDIDPGFSINPATNKPWTKEEWEAEKNKIKLEKEAIAKERAWIQQQMQQRSMNQGQGQSVNAQGIPIATRRYIPVYGGYSGSGLRSLTPWNPLFSRGQQMGMPFTGMNPYARQVTKRGLFGRPKQYIDYYTMPGSKGNYEIPNGDILASGNRLIFPNQPRKSETKTSQNKTEAKTERPEIDMTGLSMKAKQAIRAGERKSDRNDRRLARNPEYLIGSGKTPMSNEEYMARINASKREGAVYDVPGLPSEQSDYMRSQLQMPEKNNPFTGEEIYDPYEGAANPEMRYGGNLNRFIPKAQVGINTTPVAPTNPDLALGDKAGFLGNVTQGSDTSWGAMNSFSKPTPTSPEVQAFNSNPANNMAVEPMDDDLTSCTPEQKRDTTSKCYCSPEARKNPQDKRCFEGKTVGVKYDQKMNFDGEAAVNALNAGVRGITGLINKSDQNRQERQMYDNLSSDNLYASQSTKKRGDWSDLGSMSGQFRFDQQGQDRSGFSSYGKFGGYMQEGGNTYTQGDEVYMSDEDIQNFMANGGEIEYLED